MLYGDPPWNEALSFGPFWAAGALERAQERLGQPFERILYNNLWDLYARDRTPLWFWQE